MCMIYLVFFNDTPTTEIYTYLHPLTLHAALPIYHVLVVVRVAVFMRLDLGIRVERQRARLAVADLYAGVGRDPCRVDVRSEEHTSELQSLMRISYAVFCLKKKK